MASASLAVDANAGAVLENRPNSSYGSNLRLGGFLDSVVGMGQLSCQDAVKGTLFSAVAVDRTCMATVVHPCRVKSFREAVSAVMDYSRAP